MSTNDDDLFDENQDGDAGRERAANVPRGLSTSAEALSLGEAQVLSGARGVTLALFMGEVSTGKSTLLVEMWTDFMLDGALGGYRLAGTSSSLAFERRAFLSRNESDTDEPETERTRAEEEGWLHLRVADPTGGLRDLLLSDLPGERFKRVREGTHMETEFPFLSRVDCFFVVVDGGGFASPLTREVTVNRSQRLLQALGRSESRHPTARVCVLLTKVDALDQAALDLYELREAQLMTLAKKVDPQATALRLAARPAGAPEPVGLDGLVVELCRPPRRDARAPLAQLTPSRRSMDWFTR